MLIDTCEPRPERPRGRRQDGLPRWLAAFALLVVVGLATGGVVGAIALFAAVLLAIDRAVPGASAGGLREWRQ